MGLTPSSRLQAVEIVLDTARAPTITRSPLNESLGRVLARTLHADRDHPPFDRATMDGYAVRTAEISFGATLPVASEVPAGTNPPKHTPPGSCIAVATGAAVPEDFDAVIEHEQTDRSNPVRFDVKSVQPGRNIHFRGVDRAAGDVILNAPCRLGPAEIGIAASSGHHEVDLSTPPRIAIISTGEELIDIDAAPNSVQVRDSNSLMISSSVTELGGEVVCHERAQDELEATIDALSAASLNCDLLITIGGVSAGDRDYVPAAWERLGAKPLIERVPIQPGRPTRLWQHNSCVGLALPGNPVSALVCMHLFGRPWIRAALGLDPLGDWRSAPIAKPVKPNPHRTLYRACVVRDHADIPAWHGSGDLPHLAGTDGLIELPMQEEDLDAGTTCPFLPWKA